MNNNKQTLPKDLIMNNRIQIFSTIKNDQTLSAWSQVNSPALNLKKKEQAHTTVSHSHSIRGRHCIKKRIFSVLYRSEFT